MHDISRRGILAATAAGSVLTATKSLQRKWMKRSHNRNGPGTAASITVRETYLETARIQTSLFPRRQITAHCPICDIRSRIPM